MNVDLLALSLEKKKVLSNHFILSKFLWRICSSENESLFGSIITVILWVAYISYLSVGEGILIHTFFQENGQRCGKSRSTG